MNSRKKVCGSKDSFWSRARAESIAERYGQRVYECPICFCWHCTSKENWRDEFIEADKARKQLVQLEATLRNEFNRKLREKNLRINELEFALSRSKVQEGK